MSPICLATLGRMTSEESVLGDSDDLGAGVDWGGGVEAGRFSSHPVRPIAATDVSNAATETPKVKAVCLDVGGTGCFVVGQR